MKRIPLTLGQFALVDDEDYDGLSKFKWCAHREGPRIYALRGVGVRGSYKIIRMHRQIMNAPEGMVVDHVDGNPLNNQKSNLRICTQAQNNMNRRGPKPSSKNRFRGVHFFKRTGAWTAQIGVNRKKIHLGYFATENDAAKAYSEANKKYFGEFGGQLARRQ